MTDQPERPMSDYNKPYDIDAFLMEAKKAKKQVREDAQNKHHVKQRNVKAPPAKTSPTANVSMNKGNANAAGGGGHTTSISDNPLRPKSLGEFIGQTQAKEFLVEFVDGAKKKETPLPHVLLATQSGQGKTTLAFCIAEDMGRRVFMEQCPIHTMRLVELGGEMKDGDILILDEIHLQAKGRVAANGPETLYHIMEDKKIITDQGPFNYPDITIIGATTDEGLLPDAFTDRFILKPILVPYTINDMVEIAEFNAKCLKTLVTNEAKQAFAEACQGNPRKLNKLMAQAYRLQEAKNEPTISEAIAEQVLKNERIERDGLTYDQMNYLRALFNRMRWNKTSGEWVLKCSLKTLAHSIGRSGDTSFLEKRIEPILIQRGLVAIVPGGRELAGKGVARLGETLPPPPHMAAITGNQPVAIQGTP